MRYFTAMRKLSPLAVNLRNLRLERGMTQEKLGNLAKCSSVAMIESGRRTSPRSHTLTRLAKALGVTVADLWAEPRR